MKKAIYCLSPGGTDSFGGMSRFSRYLREEWNSGANNTKIIVIDSYGPGERWKMPFFYFWSVIIVMSAAILGRIQLLHLQMSERLSVNRKSLFGYIGRLFGIPIVIHLHSAEFESFFCGLSPRGQSRVVKTLKRADKVIVLGSTWASFLVNSLGIDPSNIAIVHNGVPGPVRMNDLHGAEQPCQILFLGSMTKRKGVADLLNALSLVGKATTNWKCTIAGNGKLDEFKLIAASLGIEKHVTFFGWANEDKSRDLLRSSDILVLPSYNEGLPLAILEAMSFGLAVISTSVGSIEDAVIDSETGIIVAPGSISELSSAIETLIISQDTRGYFQENGRMRYLEKFTIASMVSNIEKVFSEVTVRSS